jgi:hypothetical protein
MRVLLIGHRNPWRMEAAVQRALRRAGHTTLLFDDRRWKRHVGWRLTQRLALRAARRFQPDFVFLSKCLALDPETVAAIVRDRPNAMWYHDPHSYRGVASGQSAHVLSIGRLTETFYVTGFAAEWRALGLPAKFLPAAGDASIVPVRPESRYQCDVAFIGSADDGPRAEFIMRLAARLPLHVWGPGWESRRSHFAGGGSFIKGHAFAAVCASAKVTLGIHAVDPVAEASADGYTSDRTWMVFLAGACYVASGTTGLGRLVLDGEQCALYRDADDCVEHVEACLADDGLRSRFRTNAERFAREFHTYDQRIGTLLTGSEWINPLYSGVAVTPNVQP